MTENQYTADEFKAATRGLSPRQREVLASIAFGGDGGGEHPKTLEALERRGLIKGELETLGGRFPVTIRRY